MKRLSRALVALALILVTVVTGSVAPASAGTLTSASFTTAGTGYAVTSAKNTRYDYGFTTATSGTFTRVTATVPVGTDGSARYLDQPTVGTGWATTPDTAANSPAGDMDMRARIAPDHWIQSPYTG